MQSTQEVKDLILSLAIEVGVRSRPNSIGQYIIPEMFMKPLIIAIGELLQMQLNMIGEKNVEEIKHLFSKKEKKTK